jgi:hypothetical protein
MVALQNRRDEAVMFNNQVFFPVTITRSPHGIERRKYARHPCQQNGSCQALRPGETDQRQAAICDISLSGLSLVTPCPFDKGEILAIQLQSPLEGFRPRLFARVMHATAEEGQKWLVGCRFINFLTDYELQAFLDAAQGSMGGEPVPAS